MRLPVLRPPSVDPLARLRSITPPRSIARALSVATLAASLGVAACSTDLLGPDFVDDLDQLRSCADVFFFAIDDADRVMLTFSVAGPVAEAQAAGETTTTPFDLPDPDVTLIVEQGSRVSDAACDDVIENGGPVVDRTWSAIDGSATLTIRPGEGMVNNRADLELRDIVVRDGEGNV
ncbi:MAG: hypothetical protein KJO11_15225, partial [Gemmatimonadetes bacterium]|nr:hypothetical protein [Gemmatimonadota bacterium]